jgi:predicted small metal-binding protein
MARKYIDCSQFASDKNCTLAISGSQEEVLDMAVIHAIISHGHDDPYQLRRQLKSLLKDMPETENQGEHVAKP